MDGFPQNKPYKVARDLERIISINSAHATWVDAHVAIADVIKILRKDFHLVSTRIFFSRESHKHEIIKTIKRFEFAVIDFKTEMLMLDMHELPIAPETQVIQLRIVSPYAARYFRCLMDVNEICVLLANAEFLKKIDSTRRKSILKDMYRLAGEVKRVALGIQVEDRARRFG